MALAAPPGCAGRVLSAFPRAGVLPRLASRRRAPLIVDLIRRSGRKPEAFVLEELIRPYVKVLAYLLFEEGIQVEGHAQNVLVEIDADEGLTGRVVLRDLSDMSVSIPLRVAKRSRSRPSTGTPGPRPPFRHQRRLGPPMCG